MWREAVVGINQARARMEQIAVLEPGDYFIFDTHGGGIVARKHTEPEMDKRVHPRRARWPDLVANAF